MSDDDGVGRERDVHIIPVRGFDEAMVQAVCEEMVGRCDGDVVSASTARHLGHGVTATSGGVTLAAYAHGDKTCYHVVVALARPATLAEVFTRAVQPAIMRVQNDLLGMNVRS